MEGNYILVKVAEENSFGERLLHFSAEPAGFDTEGKIGWPGWSGINLPDELRQFMLIANHYPTEDSWLIHQPAYREMHHVDLADAERMVKVLRRVDKRIMQLAERYGSWSEPATKTAYLADALGIKHDKPFIRAVPPEKDYMGTGYHEMNGGALKDWLSWEVQAWQRKVSAAA